MSNVYGYTFKLAKLLVITFTTLLLLTAVTKLAVCAGENAIDAVSGFISAKVATDELNETPPNELSAIILSDT